MNEINLTVFQALLVSILLKYYQGEISLNDVKEEVVGAGCSFLGYQLQHGKHTIRVRQNDTREVYLVSI